MLPLWRTSPRVSLYEDIAAFLMLERQAKMRWDVVEYTRNMLDEYNDHRASLLARCLPLALHLEVVALTKPTCLSGAVN